MKKLTVVLILVFCFVFASCGESPKTPQLAEGETLVNHLIVTLPEGMTLRQTGGVKVACFEHYPEKADNISFVTGVKDLPENYTKEKLDQMFSSLVAGFSGGISLDSATISNCEVLIYTYSLVLDEKAFTGQQYLIFGSDFTDIATVTVSDTSLLESIQRMITTARIA